MASRDPTKIWKLARWVRKYPNEKHGLPQISKIKDINGSIHSEAPEIARVMAEHFFPQPVAADTTDISGTHYPEKLNGISKVVTQVEIEETLGKLPYHKVPGPDKIPNRLSVKFKATISKDLADAFNVCFLL